MPLTKWRDLSQVLALGTIHESIMKISFLLLPGRILVPNGDYKTSVTQVLVHAAIGVSINSKPSFDTFTK